MMGGIFGLIVNKIKERKAKREDANAGLVRARANESSAMQTLGNANREYQRTHPLTSARDPHADALSTRRPVGGYR